MRLLLALVNWKELQSQILQLTINCNFNIIV